MGVYKFETCNAYFRTYHNVTADDLTRKAKAEVAELLKTKELKHVDLEQAWTDHLSRDWIRRAFTWRGQDESLRKLALQLADSRTPDEVPRSLARPVPGVGFRVIEWMGHPGPLRSRCRPRRGHSPHGGSPRGPGRAGSMLAAGRG